MKHADVRVDNKHNVSSQVLLHGSAAVSGDHPLLLHLLAVCVSALPAAASPPPAAAPASSPASHYCELNHKLRYRDIPIISAVSRSATNALPVLANLS